ncbi:hypothetical protein [Methanoregula sp.]|uniref:hypothetical protein n=1 Tax=Methanoregula sp. TaxID=2052170 RepID=UPI003C769490
MDRIIKITLAVFIIILVTFVALAGYSAYVENAYRTSFAGSYTYTCTIATDSPLSNVTLFIPVPEDRNGNSPVIAQYSAQKITGVPDTWTTTLYDTGKSTLVRITIPSLVPPAGTSHAHPYAVTLSTNISSQTMIDTRNPVENSPVFRPVTDPALTGCRGNETLPDHRQCYSYQSSVYADYRSGPNASVSITSTLLGMNRWDIFGPRENEYDTDIYVLMPGENHGWAIARGYLEQGLGSDDPAMQPAARSGRSS